MFRIPEFLAEIQCNRSQRNNYRTMWNQQTTDKIEQTVSMVRQQRLLRPLISLRLFGTGAGHVSDYKMQF